MIFKVTNNGLHVADPDFTFLDSTLLTREDVSDEVAGYILGNRRRAGFTSPNFVQVLDRNISRILQEGLHGIYSN